MDLNASPEPEEDDEIFEPHSLDDNINVQFHQINRSELGESGAEIARREREERSQRLRTQRNDDPVHYASQPSVYGDAVQPKRQKTLSRLPPGWLDCPGYGQDIGLIIPSKVPLGEAFNDAIPPGKRYSFKQVINKQRVMGKKLGLVIDLTNTNRYYSLQELRKDAIKHVKIACKGRDSVPDNESVNNFVYEVSQFLMRQKHAKKHILVHCTHGHNRTGYMIVHYLMRTSSMSVTQAIKTFADARPPGIYKPDYIDGLYAFYHEKKPEMVVCPETPKWKSTELDLNGDAMPDDDDDGTSAALPPVNTETSTIVMTNDDTLGDVIPLEQQETMRQFVYQSLKLPAAGGKGYSVFPGSHPVSLDSENVKLLRQRYYYATWKADGTRYMMLITMDGCYLIDRHFTFRRVQMRFPCRTNEGIAERTHHYTLLDGEMVIDTVPDSRKQERRYLIYDMMAINSVSIVERPFYERWKMLEKEIIEPRNYERQHIYQSRNPYYRYELEPFRVRRKDFWLLSTVTRLLKEFIPRLSHEADGLIFQGWDDPYVPRTHAGLLKWKYASMNSVDFLFEVDENRECLYLLDRGRKKLMEGNTVVFEDGADPQTYDKKIIECTSEANRVWKFMRVRVDKSSPNEMNTYRKVLKSINDNITEEILLAEISETIQLPMYADRIQRDSKPHHHPNSARRR